MIGVVSQQQDEFTRFHFRLCFFIRGDRHAVAHHADGCAAAAGEVIAVFHRTEQIACDRAYVGCTVVSGDRADIVAVFDARRCAHRVPRGDARNVIRAADRTEVIAVFDACVAVVRIAEDARDLSAVLAAAVNPAGVIAAGDRAIALAGDTADLRVAVGGVKQGSDVALVAAVNDRRGGIRSADDTAGAGALVRDADAADAALDPAVGLSGNRADRSVALD